MVYDDQVRQALHAALQALRERAHIYRLLLEDGDVYAVANPNWLHSQATKDETSADVLDGLLSVGRSQQS
jgi:hypothetical protein